MNKNEIMKNVLTPCYSGVLLKFYENNPYNEIAKTSGGIIVGGEGGKRYKSNETGEIEENIQMIAPAVVIAVGPDCKNVKVGEDVFCYRNIAHPLPYYKKGYYMLNEQNIHCRVTSPKKSI